MKIRKRYISCMIILLLLGAGIGSSYFATAPAAPNGPHNVIEHSVSLVAGGCVCFQDNIRNNKNKPLTIDVSHTGTPDLEGINIILYWAVWHNHGYMRGDEIEFPITVKPHRTLRFFICYYTDIRLKPDTYILETTFNICEDDDIPTVEITKPMKRSLYINNRWVRSWWRTTIIGGVDVEVDAYDKDGIDRVEFYIGKKLKATDTTEPYTWMWDERVFGSRMVEVKAYDNAGNSNTAKMRVLIFNK